MNNDNTVLTPIESHGGYLLKRDDLFTVAGAYGGKVRTCWALAQGARGLVTAGSRKSPQVNIVAHIAKHLNIPCRVHTPQGELSPEVLQAKEFGAEVIQHRAGYNSVIIARAREDAKANGFTEIPFGMKTPVAVTETAKQVLNLPLDKIKRIVVPVGSGMSLSGILTGLQNLTQLDGSVKVLDVKVLGVVVGANPTKRLNSYAPLFYEQHVDFVNAGVDYHKEVEARLGDVLLDPVYEAKCVKFLQPGDLLWCVGIRNTARI